MSQRAFARTCRSTLVVRDMVAGYEPSEAKAKCPESELRSNETVWQTGRVIVGCTKEAVSKFDLTQPRSYNVVSLLLTARLGYLFTQTIVELCGIDELFDSHMHTIFPIVGVDSRHVDALIERIFAA